MVNLFDEFSGHELRELVSNGLFAVLSELAEPLLDWLCSFFVIKGVLDHLPGDTRHVGRLPSEDVLVCPEEGDERAFLFIIELCPNQSHFGRIGQVERDFLDVLVGADSRFSCFLGRNFSFVPKGGRSESEASLLGLGLDVLCKGAALLVTAV